MQKEDKEKEKEKKRKPYQKPALTVEKLFEATVLSCGKMSGQVGRCNRLPLTS